MAVLSLALGIGANAAIFSLLYQVTLRSLPVKDPQALVLLTSDDFNLGYTRKDNNKTVFSYPMYQALRDRNQVLSGLVARTSFPVSLAWRGDATRATAEVVTGNFFGVLGLKPALGRLLTSSDDGVPGQNPVIVLSYAYWESHLGRDPGVLNSRMLMNRHPVLVIGVAPQGFRGLLAGQTPEFFAPLSMTEIVAPGWHWRDVPSAYWLNLVGRLRPGVTRLKAQAMLLPLFRSTIQDGLERSEGLSEEHRKRILAKPLTLEPVAQGLNEFGDQFRTPLVVLMVMVGLVLLIACTNVASLLIARATARQRETAMRLAPGASGWQIVRQFLIESLGLTLLGALAGVFISGVLAKGLLNLLPADESGGWLAAHVDLRVIGFSFVLALVTGLLFGLVPALQAARPDLAPALKEQGGGLSAGGSQPRIRRGLVAAQICISLLLLSGAGLFTRSLMNLLAVDLGFHPNRLVVFSVEPGLSGYSWERTLAFFDSVQQRLRSLPSVGSVSGAASSPFGGSHWGNGVKVPGSRYANDRYVDCQQNSVGPGYFRTLGIPLLMGREFDARDARQSPKVAVINQTFARFLFENGDPLGRHMVIGSSDSDVQIVGVVKDSKFGGVREKPGRFMYVPYEQAESDFVKQAAFFVRTGGDERAVLAAVRPAVRQLDPNLPIARLTSMQIMIGDSIYRDRLLVSPL